MFDISALHFMDFTNMQTHRKKNGLSGTTTVVIIE